MDETHRAYHEALIEYRDKYSDEYRELSKKLLVTTDDKKQILLDQLTIASNRRTAANWAVDKFQKIVLRW